MTTVLIVLAFLAFIAWRESQHRIALAEVSRSRGGRARAPVASSRRRERKPARVISAEDDKAFNEAHPQEALAEDHGGVAEELEDEEDEV